MAMVHKKDDYLLAPAQTAQKGQLSQRGATGAENTPNGQQIMQTPAGSSAGGAGGKSVSVTGLGHAAVQTGINPMTDRRAGSQSGDYDLAMGYLNDYKNNKFSYDFNSDPIFQQAKDAYLRQGIQNARNVAAQAAQLTGGYGNSYGTVAAQSVMNQAAERVNDLIPQLEQNAYGRWQDEQNRNLTLAQQYLALDDRAYDRAWNENERDYSREQDRINRQDRLDELAYQHGLDEREHEDYLNERDYGREQDRLNRQDRLDELAYQHEQDALDRAERQDATAWERQQAEENAKWSRALSLANMGSFGALSDLGIDVSTPEKQYLFDLGLQYADLGDFSLLEKLGVNADFLKSMQAYQLQAAAAAGSGGSGGSGSRSSGSRRSSYSYTPAEEEPEPKSTGNPIYDFIYNLGSNAAALTERIGFADEENSGTHALYNSLPGTLDATPMGEGKGEWRGYTNYVGPGGSFMAKVDENTGAGEVWKWDSSKNKYRAYDPVSGKYL